MLRHAEAGSIFRRWRLQWTLPHFARTPQASTPTTAAARWRSQSTPYESSDAPSPVASSSDRAKDLLRQALASHNRGDLYGAASLFHQVLTIDPHNADANFNLGAMSEDQGDLNGALKYYQSAAASNPSDSDVRDAVASVRDKMRQQQVAQQTTQQLQQKQQLRGVAQDAASAYKAGKYDQAIGDLNQVLRQSPNDANALFGLAQAYRGKGDKAQASQYLSRAIAIAPNNQLYRATMNDLNNDPQQQGSVADGGPAAAPDYSGGGHHHHGNRGDSNGSDGGHGGNGGGYGSDQATGWQDGNICQAVASQADGQITPFTEQGNSQLQGHANGNSGGMGMGGMGGIAAGLYGLGGMGMGMLGMGMLNGGVRRMGGGSYYGGGGTRLVRNAVLGSLAGAAIGGLMNMHGAGGVRAGAMRGAASGGLMGLITGF